MKKLFLSLMAIVAFAAISFGQNATAQATVVAQHSMGNGSPLSFGTFAITGAGSITVNNAGAVTAHTGCSSPTGTSASSFILTGSGTENFWVALPATDITIRKDGTSVVPEEMMTVNTFTCNAGQSLATHSALVDGSFTLNVGAILNFTGIKTAGSYSGTYNVTAHWE